jgi:hypothetical protein
MISEKFGWQPIDTAPIDKDVMLFVRYRRSGRAVCGPQYEKGFPEFCQVPSPRLPRNIVSSMLDLMPSPRLVFHEWDRHGLDEGVLDLVGGDCQRRPQVYILRWNLHHRPRLAHSVEKGAGGETRAGAL